jgi:hypothetical protein
VIGQPDGRPAAIAQRVNHLRIARQAMRARVALKRLYAPRFRRFARWPSDIHSVTAALEIPRYIGNMMRPPVVIRGPQMLGRWQQPVAVIDDDDFIADRLQQPRIVRRGRRTGSDYADRSFFLTSGGSGSTLHS